MKMTEGELLSFLDAEQDAAYSLNAGDIAAAREAALRDYLRLPYGNEEEGRTSVVTSDVFDQIEGMLPDLIDVFVSSEKAVVFDPVGPEDEKGAKQATDACNYVFYKCNNGFLLLYSAAKDALMLKTGGLKWWWDERRTVKFTRHTADEMQLAQFLASTPDAEVVEKEEAQPTPEMMAQAQAMGLIELPKVYSVKIKTVEKKGKVCIEPVPPDELEVSARHRSLLMDDCPYVAHVTERTLSDLIQMGYDVTVDDVRAAQNREITQDRSLRDDYRSGRDGYVPDDNELNDSMVRGWVRDEYVLVDFDGDGIAERRNIVRLGTKILRNEECSHVPLAAWTPYILTHQFHGLSVAELVSDIQRLSTDLFRQQWDNLLLANNQETVVLTDSQGNPLANLDDLLNRRPGGIIRERAAGAIRPYQERWQGIEAMPMVEMLAVSKENRTGYTRYSQGLDGEALNKTATGITKIMNATQKRMKLMARIMGEALVAPMFRGIFKTLQDYQLEALSFRLNGNYVQVDPQEWRDGYDMTINVGIGNGDNLEQIGYLTQMTQMQMALLNSPLAGRVVTEQNVFATQARIAEKAGFKNPAEFWTDPSTVPPPPPAPPPPEMMKIQAEMQAKQAETQIKMQTAQADIAHKQQTAQIDLEVARVELEIKKADLALRQQALELKREEAILDAQVAQQRAAMFAADDMARARQVEGQQ